MGLRTEGRFQFLESPQGLGQGFGPLGLRVDSNGSRSRRGGEGSWTGAGTGRGSRDGGTEGCGTATGLGARIY